MSQVIDAAEFGTWMNGFVSELEVGDFTDGLDLCRADIANNFVEIFDARESSTGQPWAPHAPSTVQRYGVHPLLILTSAMYQSVTTDFGGPGSYIVNSSRVLEWGTRVEYAEYQNYGTSRIPAREFIYWTDAARDACVETFGDWLIENVARV